MKRTIAVVFLILSACDRLDTFPLAPDAGMTMMMNPPPPDAGMPGPLVRFKPIDVLFVVDNSGSMQDEQENLARNFESFADQIIGYVDYRIAVITTDMDSASGEQEGLTISSFKASPPHRLTEISQATCSSIGTEHGCFRSASGQNIVVASSMPRADQIAAFESNAQVGTCGSGRERAFDALLGALEQMMPGGCNEGFLRPEANLVIIFVSDEEDDSTLPIEMYVDAIGTYKPWPQVRVGAIVGAIGGQPSTCSIANGASCGGICNTPPPSGSHTACTTVNGCVSGEYCTQDQICENADLLFWTYCSWCSYYAAPDCCQALPGSRYVALARGIEDRVTAARSDIPDRECVGLGTRVACLVDTICQDSFGDTMARIAQELCLDEETP